MKPQTPLFKKLLDPLPPLRENCGIVMIQRKVINISDIGRGQHPGHEMVERVEIEIGEELAGEIADRQTTPPLIGREQIIARKMEIDRLLLVRAIDDCIEEPERPLAADATAEGNLQDCVVDGGEITIHIAAEHMAVAVPKALIGGDGLPHVHIHPGHSFPILWRHRLPRRPSLLRLINRTGHLWKASSV